jgi:hypothetical protein
VVENEGYAVEPLKPETLTFLGFFSRIHLLAPEQLLC